MTATKEAPTADTAAAEGSWGTSKPPNSSSSKSNNIGSSDSSDSSRSNVLSRSSRRPHKDLEHNAAPDDAVGADELDKAVLKVHLRTGPAEI